MMPPSTQHPFLQMQAQFAATGQLSQPKEPPKPVQKRNSKTSAASGVSWACITTFSFLPYILRPLVPFAAPFLGALFASVIDQDPPHRLGGIRRPDPFPDGAARVLGQQALQRADGA